MLLIFSLVMLFGAEFKTTSEEGVMPAFGGSLGTLFVNESVTLFSLGLLRDPRRRHHLACRLLCSERCHAGIGARDLAVTNFDKLDARSQSIVLGSLVSNLLLSRCSSLREMAARLHSTPAEVWDRICVRSGLQPCSIPPRILGHLH